MYKKRYPDLVAITMGPLQQYAIESCTFISEDNKDARRKKRQAL